MWQKPAHCIMPLVVHYKTTISYSYALLCRQGDEIKLSSLSSSSHLYILQAIQQNLDTEVFPSRCLWGFLFVFP